MEFHLRLFGPLAALLFATAPTFADEMSCRGRDLIPVLQKEQPAQYEALMAASAQEKHGQGLFFRLDKAGKPPIHVFGTIHVEDEAFKQFPPVMIEALDQADIIATELKESELSDPFTMLKIAALVANPKADTLKAFNETERKQIEAALFTRGILPSAAERMDAGFLMLSLALPACAIERDPEKLLTREVVDQTVARRGEALGATNIGLETITAQIGTILSLGVADKRLMLSATAAADSLATDAFITMKKLYGQGEIGKLKHLAQVTLPPDPAIRAAYNAFMHKLLDKRNTGMVESILAKADTQTVFAAVGALHLVGDQGVVALLEAAGYKATKLW
jgi:uncharacterized protein